MSIASLPLFSDDEELIEDGLVDKCISRTPSKDNDDSDEILVLDKMVALLKRNRPALVTRQLSCRDILKRIDENKGLFDIKTKPKVNTSGQNKFFYKNNGEVSEKMAELSLKIQSRFIQNESLSTCNPLRNAKTRLSPERRLSHLARRRQVFSRENLKQLSQMDAKTHRLEIQKNALKDRVMRASGEQSRIPKRALFQSPDKEPVRPGFQTIVRPLPRRLFSDEEQKVEPPTGVGRCDVKQWLASQNFEANSKKRRRGDSRDSDRKRSCPRRSLDFRDRSPSKCSESSDRSTGPPVLQPILSSSHKQKMLWAVSQALQEKGIRHKDPLFKPCALRLFGVCKQNYPAIIALKITGGMSAKMLHFARDRIIEIINQIKGKMTVLEDVSKSVLNEPGEARTHVDTKVVTEKENVRQLTTPKKQWRKRTWNSCYTTSWKEMKRISRSKSCEYLSDVSKGADWTQQVNQVRRKLCMDLPTPAFHEIVPSSSLQPNTLSVPWGEAFAHTSDSGFEETVDGFDFKETGFSSYFYPSSLHESNSLDEIILVEETPIKEEFVLVGETPIKDASFNSCEKVYTIL